MGMANAANAAQQFAAQKKDEPKAGGAVEAADDEEEAGDVDESGLEEKDIELVMSQVPSEQPMES